MNKMSPRSAHTSPSSPRGTASTSSSDTSDSSDLDYKPTLRHQSAYGWRRVTRSLQCTDAAQGHSIGTARGALPVAATAAATTSAFTSKNARSSTPRRRRQSSTSRPTRKPRVASSRTASTSGTVKVRQGPSAPAAIPINPLEPLLSRHPLTFDADIPKHLDIHPDSPPQLGDDTTPLPVTCPLEASTLQMTKGFCPIRDAIDAAPDTPPPGPFTLTNDIPTPSTSSLRLIFTRPTESSTTAHVSNSLNISPDSLSQRCNITISQDGQQSLAQAVKWQVAIDVWLACVQVGAEGAEAAVGLLDLKYCAPSKVSVPPATYAARRISSHAPARPSPLREQL